MTVGPNARITIMWVVIAILSYLCLEMYLDWTPLGFSVASLLFPLLGILLVVAAVWGCFVLSAERHSH